MVREFSESTASNRSRWASRQGASHLPARGHKGPSPAGTPKGVSRGARRAGTRRLRAHCALADRSPHTAEPRVAVATGGGGGWRMISFYSAQAPQIQQGTLGLIEPGAGNSDEPKEHRRRVAIATCRERNAEIARKSSLATISPNDSRCMTLDVVHATPVPLLWAPHQPRAAEPVRARASGHLAWRLLARFGGDPRPGFAAQCHHRSAQSPVRAYARRVVRSAAAAG
jgi:hypothetical protein